VRWILWAVVLSGCVGAKSGLSPSEGAARAAYERDRQPARLIEALHLQRGEVVADVGAGAGYLTHRLARAVGPTGRVIATDVDASALARIETSPESTAGEAPIATRLVSPDAPGLELGVYDLILLSEVDQYLPDRARYLAALAHALRPRGRIAVTNRFVYRAPLALAAAQAGLTLVAPSIDLPAHYLVFLEAHR
jgi:tRNA A58 N-methylase Trm61